MPSGSDYTSYLFMLLNRKDKEVILDIIGFRIESEIRKILYESFINIERNICIIVPNPVVKRVFLRYLPANKKFLPQILTHLQWDVVEGAPMYDIIIASSKSSFNRREINLLKAKSKKKLIFLNGF